MSTQHPHSATIKQQKKPSLFILLLLAPFASLSAVLFTPALPQIADLLRISDSQAQLTMTVFLFGYAFGNLPYGLFANRFGRKPALYLGTLLAAFGSLIIIFAGYMEMYWLFLVGRFLSALGSSVGMKISFTMIGDVYQHEQATKKISMLALAFAIAPGLAIALGGFLTTHFGWESCFYALVVYSLALFFFSFSLPETCHQVDAEAFNFSNIKSAYQRKLRNKKLILCALILGCSTSIIYLFSTLAPFLGINTIGLTPQEYGLLNFIPPLGMVAGSIAAHSLASRKDKLSVMLIGTVITIAFILLMFFLFLFGRITPWSLFLPVPFIYFGLALVFPNASGFAMTHAKDKSNASAVMNFINIMVSVMALFIAEAIPSQILYAMPLLFVIFGILMFFLRRQLSKQI